MHPRSDIVNNDILEGKWKQLQGQAREWWGKLTDDDLKQVGGKFDQFVGLLQQRYGYSREQAEAEISQRITTFEASKLANEVQVK